MVVKAAPRPLPDRLPRGTFGEILLLGLVYTSFMAGGLAAAGLFIHPPEDEDVFAMIAGTFAATLSVILIVRR